MTSEEEDDDNLFLLIDLVTSSKPVSSLVPVLKTGVDVNKSLKQHLRPLHYAAYCDRDEVVKTLVEYGARVNLSDQVRKPSRGGVIYKEEVEHFGGSGAENLTVLHVIIITSTLSFVHDSLSLPVHGKRNYQYMVRGTTSTW